MQRPELIDPHSDQKHGERFFEVGGVSSGKYPRHDDEYTRHFSLGSTLGSVDRPINPRRTQAVWQEICNLTTLLSVSVYRKEEKMLVLESPSDILRQFCHGDLGAFEALFRQHQRQVYGWIVRIVRDPAAAEDVTIETFWRIHRAHARFDPDRSFEAWARRIATNAALDHLRTVRRDAPLPDHLASPSVPNPGVSEEVRQKTARAFRRLPPKLQVAATLALIEEQPYQEIAGALGISVGAVKLRVFRSLRLLRKELKRQGIEP
jgi:RNA polymerase sigma-70 factor (ECF subfamily)